VYEYLACGKPVVLTADKVREELERFVHYAHTAGEFASACVAACNGARRPELAAIHKILSEHTWDRRAQRALALCEEVMRGKG
jgi:glycosyltransferase involved in cell wall biosynthesis